MHSFSAAKVSERTTAPLGPTIVVRPARESYVFVDNIRFLAMAAFFVEHSILTTSGVLDWGMPRFSHFVVCLMKFGSVGFFMVSGFLLGKNIETAGPLAYMRKRFGRIFLPWLFWVSLFAAVLELRQWRTDAAGLNGVAGAAATLGALLVHLVAYTPYWFVPQLLLAMCALLVFRRHLGSLWLGASLGAVSVFYGANVYLHWLPPTHSLALFGFTFYLWLGYYVSNRLQEVQRWAARVPYQPVLGLALLLCAASYAESVRLYRLFPHDDPNNSLRLTSQLYSIVVVFLLFKIKVPAWPKRISVRDDTFGLYLLQTPVLFFAGSTLHRLIPASVIVHLRSTQGDVLLSVLVTVGVYSVSLGIAKFLLTRRTLRWTVGGAPLAVAEGSPRESFRETLMRLLRMDGRVL